eukprot:TRINITY_DN55805_c0_g1_i1.p1 TRINITY_DN55805_c0_g1~~TRINITY_DN55805_c0_g1_i1.p1  ORF type:complete len:520 (+),score=161.55 TRINITY_DN55805_c0_g1_i1:68-1627(+)
MAAVPAAAVPPLPPPLAPRGARATPSSGSTAAEAAAASGNEGLAALLRKREEYRPGFRTDIAPDRPFGLGLSEDTVRRISAKRGEPQWLTDWRLRAFRHWLTLRAPQWPRADLPPVDFAKVAFFSEPKKKPKLKSLDDLDPEMRRTFQKLGIPLEEQKVLANVATDVVFDSSSVVTTFRDRLAKAGVKFCSLREAVRDYPELVRRHLGSVVPFTDNYWAALNSAVFTDGSFVHIPKGVQCPMELSTYFRLNDSLAGQFERTLVVAEEGAKVSYLEGCTAPAYDNNQLHAAVVELIAEKSAEIDYATVQNWYPGNREGRGGVLNYVTKRGLCKGDRSRIRWAQVEAGSAVTWKYPSCVLRGAESVGEFYSVALTTGRMQADTGTKMIHLGPGTRSTVIAKGISADRSRSTFRSRIAQGPRARGARSFTQCDSLIIGDQSQASTVPTLRTGGPPGALEHEASVARIDEERMHYLRSRGLDTEQALRLVVSGFCGDVVRKLPQEFAAEASALLGLKLAGTVG